MARASRFRSERCESLTIASLSGSGSCTAAAFSTAATIESAVRLVRGRTTSSRPRSAINDVTFLSYAIATVGFPALIPNIAAWSRIAITVSNWEKRASFSVGTVGPADDAGAIATLHREHHLVGGVGVVLIASWGDLERQKYDASFFPFNQAVQSLG